MTNHEAVRVILEDYIKIPKEFPRTNEVAQAIIDDKNYFIGVMACVTYLGMRHPTFLDDLIDYVKMK